MKLKTPDEQKAELTTVTRSGVAHVWAGDRLGTRFGSFTLLKRVATWSEGAPQEVSYHLRGEDTAARMLLTFSPDPFTPDVPIWAVDDADASAQAITLIHQHAAVGLAELAALIPAATPVVLGDTPGEAAALGEWT